MKKRKLVSAILCVVMFATIFALAVTMNVCGENGGEPLYEEIKLVADDATYGDEFGRAVSISGNTAVIGAIGDDAAAFGSGSAYIFVQNENTWTQQDKLVADDGAYCDWFGHSVSISEDTALVGAYFDDDGGEDSGSAYVFVRSGTTWIQQAKLVADDAAAGDHFGNSVSINGDTAVIGAYGNDDAGEKSGSAYVFVRSDTTWIQQAKLVADDAASEDSFGIDVSISGDTAVIGAWFDDDAGGGSGSAYVFVRSGTTWTQQAKLVADDAAAGDLFGLSVSINGDTIVIGAQGNDDNGELSGSAYVFIRSGTTWTQQNKLVADDGTAGDLFGRSVSISGDTAVIGAWFDNDAGDEAGSAYIFRRSGSTWNQGTKLMSSDITAGDQFGNSVSISGDTILIAAHYDDESSEYSGSAYIFYPWNYPPEASAGGSYEEYEGSEIIFDASGSTDPDGNEMQYRWDFENDGTWDTDWSTSPTSGHTWYDDYSGTVKVEVTDGVQYDTATASVTVNNAPPIANAGSDKTGVEPSPFTFTGSHTDPGTLDIHTYEWDLDYDGETFDIDATGIEVLHTYEDDFDGLVALRVTDDDGDSSIDTASVTVTNVAPTADAGSDKMGTEPSFFTFIGSHTDPGTLDIHTYEWDFDYDGETFDVDATGNGVEHTWEDDFEGVVALRVTDDDGGSSIDMASVSVSNVAPAADAGSDKSGYEVATFTFSGSHTDPGTLDTHTYEWDLDYDWITFDVDATGNCNPHTWEDDFDGTVALRVTDDDGGWHIDTCSVVVNNVAPIVETLTVPIDPIKINEPVDISGTFSDPGILDTHTATITWAEGIETAGAVSGYSVTGSYPYSSAGVYTITLTVSDDDGGSGSFTAQQYVVVYDPSGGFVTGGGWINSPEGAYGADPSLTGKASFGFVAKYKKSISEPTGNTEFQFKAGDLNFHSDSYEWLVIAGARAIFKGTGTINGESNYKFMLWAVDGEIPGGEGEDKFRIKIWQEGTEGIEEVIYDNGAETPLGGGQIVIHTKGK